MKNLGQVLQVPAPHPRKMRKKLLIALVTLLAVIFMLCLAFAVAMRVRQGSLPEIEPGREVDERVTAGTTDPSSQHALENTTEGKTEERETTAAPEETAPPLSEPVSPSNATNSSETTAPGHEETQPTSTAPEETQDADELPIVPNI